MEVSIITSFPPSQLINLNIHTWIRGYNQSISVYPWSFACVLININWYWYSSIKCNNVNFPTISHPKHTQLNKWSNIIPSFTSIWRFHLYNGCYPHQATKYEFLVVLLVAMVGSYGSGLCVKHINPSNISL